MYFPISILNFNCCFLPFFQAIKLLPIAVTMFGNYGNVTSVMWQTMQAHAISTIYNIYKIYSVRTPARGCCCGWRCTAWRATCSSSRRPPPTTAPSSTTQATRPDRWLNKNIYRPPKIFITGAWLGPAHAGHHARHGQVRGDLGLAGGAAGVYHLR